MSMTRLSDKRTGFLCYLINCLSFQNTVFDFEKHLKKIRPSPGEIQQATPKLILRLESGGGRMEWGGGRCYRVSNQNNKLLTGQETAVN